MYKIVNFFDEHHESIFLSNIVTFKHVKWNTKILMLLMPKINIIKCIFIILCDVQ